jgi:1-acyl-sn-glycerol-3-phosphate acyltransferase
VAFLIVIVVGNIIILITALIRGDMKAVMHKFIVMASKFMLAISFIKIKVEGEEDFPCERPLIMMPNHQGHFDYLILLAILPLRFSFIIKKELFSIPFFGRIARASGFFSIDRRAWIASHNTMDMVGAALKRAESILIFPEGTRTWNGKVGEFKGGGLLLSFRLGIPIVPIAISGSLGILRRSSFLISPRLVKLKIGKPIRFPRMDEVDLETYKNAINNVREEVAKMVSELEKGKAIEVF